MMTKAEALQWLSKATPDEIAQRLLRAEREAFLWHVIETVGQMSEATRAEVRKVAEALVAGGYRRPEGQ